MFWCHQKEFPWRQSVSNLRYIGYFILVEINVGLALSQTLDQILFKLFQIIHVLSKKIIDGNLPRKLILTVNEIINRLCLIQT